jgi:very-short-patch-repair endonuclease
MQDTKTLEFIIKAKEVWNDKYDYTDTVYKEICGYIKFKLNDIELKQKAKDHLNGIISHTEYICSDSYKKEKTDNFIEKSKAIWKDRYDYSKTEFKNIKEKVILIDNLDGKEYSQIAQLHLNGQEIYKYNRSVENEYLNTDTFGNLFDYSKVVYINNRTDVILIYKGIEYNQQPKEHLKGSVPRKMQKEYNSFIKKNEFINEAKLKFGDRYSYDDVDFIDMRTKVKIKDNITNQYIYKIPESLLNDRNKTIKLTTSEFIEKTYTIHGDKYDYSKVDYINSHTPVQIYCNTHKEYFYQKAFAHMYGAGCPKCSHSFKKDKEYFVELSNKIHNNKYNYDNFEYITSKTKSEIICPIHGTFLLSPNSHTKKLNPVGCPKCINISHGENIIKNILEENNIIYTRQKKFENCKHINILSFDFYLNDYNIIIEFDGIQHFKPVKRFGGEERFIENQIKDEIKNRFCQENNIYLLRIKYNQINNIKEIILNFIKNI